jgi:nitronate monooxygenase
MNKSWRSLRFGELRASIPIIQGGMGVGVSMSGLAASVADQGGVGVIAAAGIGMLEPDGFSNFLEASIRAFKREIRKARAMTRGILGVNIMVALSNFGDMVRTAVEEKVDIIFAGAGLPLNLPEFLQRGCGTKLVPIISSARAAGLLIRRWLGKYGYLPDALVVEGPLAGGHLGFKTAQIQDPEYSLEKLIPEVIAEVRPFEAERRKLSPPAASTRAATSTDSSSAAPRESKWRPGSSARRNATPLRSSRTHTSPLRKRISSSSRARWGCRGGPSGIGIPMMSKPARKNPSSARTTAS